MLKFKSTNVYACRFCRWSKRDYVEVSHEELKYSAATRDIEHNNKYMV